MPSYNAAHTLRDAMESLARQTFTDFDVILVDDGSSDDSARISSEFAAKDPRFHVIRKPHTGIVDSLCAAASEAPAPLLARMDADDIAEPTRFEKQVAFLDAHPNTGLCGTHVSHLGEPAGLGRRRYLDWLNNLGTTKALERERFVECPIAHPTFLMRRDAFDAAGGYAETGWPEDYDLLLRIHSAGWNLGIVPEPLLRWRHAADRLSMNDGRYAPERFRAVKRHHLIDSVLDTSRPFYQWGAGEVGKPWLREWGSHRPQAVVDINPRKLGKQIHAVPVIPPDELPGPGDALTLVAVGAPGARDDIRAWFTPRGYTEGADYYFIA